MDVDRTQLRRQTLSRELPQVLRFVATGVVNNICYYGVYLLLVTVIPYLAAHVIAYVLSILVALTLTTRYTFRVSLDRHRALRFPVAYVGTLAATTGVVLVLVRVVGIDKHLAPLGAVAVTVPLGYLASRWAMQPEGDL